MKKRDVFLFLSFAALFVLFTIFQNFSFPTKQFRQLDQKGFFQKQIRKFVPTYAFNEFIGESIEAPYGYKVEIERKIASLDEPVIFDNKKFLRENIEGLPVYKDLKNFIDFSDATAELSENNCPIEPSAEPESSINIKTNPFRKTASISVPGEIKSQMSYVGDRKSVNVQFKKDLNNDAGIKLEIDSEAQSGVIKFDVQW